MTEKIHNGGNKMKKRLTFIALVICLAMIMIPIFSNMTVGAVNVEITVNTLTGKTIPITIDNTETVLALKTRIQEKEGVPPAQQRLTFAGKQLEEDKTLEYYNIQNGATIHLVLRLNASTASIRKGVSAISGYNTESNTYNYIYYGTWRNAPIKWRVLDTKSNTGDDSAMFLLTDECLYPLPGGLFKCYIQFNPADKADRYLWKDSTLQTWFSEFYNSAFTDTERTQIPAVSLAGGVYSYRSPGMPSYYPAFEYKIDALESEYVFAPSIQDLYNADYGFGGSTSRIAGPMLDSYTGTRYWIRSYYNNLPHYVGEGDNLVGDQIGDLAAVRPAMNLTKENNILFISAAEGGKPSGGLAALAEYTGSEWKLTLSDSTRSGFSVESTSVSTTNYGGDIEIKYSGAKTGANEYISVMLTDSAGNPTYYGRSSASLTSESGTATIPVAAGLTAGDYTLYVFNEQYNGDKMTDYASELKSVAMTVREANTYTVTYAPGANGTGTAFTTNKVEGIDLVLSSKTFSRTDYKQIGWSKVDGGEKDYALGAIYTADEPITLYPVWERQYGLTISGKDVTSSNQDDVFGDGKVKFEYDYYRYKYILTLTDASLDDDGFAVIDYSGSNTIEIVLVGKNELNSSGFAGIISSGRLIFSGEGSLKLSVTDEYANAIDCKGIIVNGGDITIEAAGTAIYTDGTVSVNDGSLTLVITGDGSIIDGATGNVVNVAPGVVIEAGAKADGTDAAPVNASETDKITSAKYLKIYKVPHIHCICGGHGYDGHDAHTDIEWEPWGESDSLPTSGYYYLTCNVELPYDEGVFDTTHICLNGYSIRGMKRDDGALSPFTPWLATHGEFVITDCGGGSIGDLTLSGGKMTMYGGSIPEGTTLAIVKRGEFYAESGAEINGKIINSGKISGGTFNGEVLNEQGTIGGGTFNGKVTNKGGTINDGTFTGTVDNVLFPYYYDDGGVSGGNAAHINGGIFTETSTVNNIGCFIENGTFHGKVTVTGYYDGPDGLRRPGDINGGTFTETSEVTVAIQGGISGGRVGGGNFSGTVRLEGGVITDCPTFTESSRIYLTSGYVESGIFYGTVTYGEAVIYDSACRTVTFATDGGSAIDSQRILRGQKAKKPENPTKQGYNFSGWSGGENEFDFDAPVLDNVTATAKWSVNKYTITIKPGNGEDDIVITQEFGTALTAPTLAKTGHTFAGWDVDFPETMPAKNMTIFAKWTVNKYTIRFNTDGGTYIFPITADYGSKIHNPGTLYKPGFIFDGWDRPYPETMPAENITLTAKWKVCDHSRSNQKASCKDAVKCSVCKGFIDIAEHTPSEEYKSDGSSHWHICTVCGEKLDQAEHTGGKANCHEKAECDICHAPYGEVDTSAHHGGKATCSKKAVCDECGKEYGNFDPANHAEIIKVNGKNATAATFGTKEHYKCSGCGKLFSDGDGKTEVTAENLIIGKLPPKITEGDGNRWVESSEKPLAFRSDAAFEDFTEVLVDGEKLSSESYAKFDDGIKIELLPEYLGTLSEGAHTITIRSEWGEATAEFSVEKTAAAKSLAWLRILIVIIVTGGGVTAYVIIRKKKNSKKSADK